MTACYVQSSPLYQYGTVVYLKTLQLSHANIFPHRHTIQSGIWSSWNLTYFEGRAYTVRDAIDYWYWNVSDTDEGVGFRDMCSGPHCNNNCPERFILEREGAHVWSTGAKITIAVIVVAIALICLLMKV